MSVHYTPKALATVLQARESITVISHYNPDPDAFGSSCGLGLALKALGKKVTIVNQNAPVARLSWIPGAELIVSDVPTVVDTLVICDCGAWDRIGERILPSIPKNIPLTVNIDHHSSNDLFGDACLVKPEASSTSELIFQIISHFPKKALTADVATALLAGVYADTGSFRHADVSSGTFLVAGSLLDAGADLQKVSHHLFSSNSLASVKLQSAALSGLRTEANGKVVWIVVSEELLQQTGATIDDAEGLAERGRDIDGVLVSAAARFDGDVWRVSLRSMSDQFDVSAIAGSFGGGGHKAAAAFRSRKPISEIEASLIPKLISLVQS